MQITNQLHKQQDKAKTNLPGTAFNDRHHLCYLTPSEKIDACAHGRKVELNPEMIEKFYFRLLPITYHDWFCKN